jgi:signal transduction histidine kinase
LVQKLLAFARSQRLVPKELDLNALLTGMEGKLRDVLGRAIELEMVLDPRLGQAHADPARLEEVVVHLAGNAREAMPRGGRLHLETRNVDLDEAAARAHPGLPPGPYVVLAVADTGQGLDEATRARLFQPFFTTKGVGGGAGLGLAAAYGVVRQSGGHIEVESEPGRGTTFTIYLPRRPDPVQTGRTLGPPDRSG